MFISLNSFGKPFGREVADAEARIKQMIHAIRTSPFDIPLRSFHPATRTGTGFEGLLRALPNAASGDSGPGTPATPGDGASFDLEQIPAPGDLTIPNPNPNPWDSAAIKANLDAVNQYYEKVQSYRDEYGYESAYNQWLASGQESGDDGALAPTRENTSTAFLARICGAASMIQNSGKGPGGLDAATALQELANGGNVIISAMGKTFKPQSGGSALQAQDVIAGLSPDAPA